MQNTFSLQVFHGKLRLQKSLKLLYSKVTVKVNYSRTFFNKFTTEVFSTLLMAGNNAERRYINARLDLAVINHMKLHMNRYTHGNIFCSHYLMELIIK